MDQLALALRVVFSLAVVLGIMWALSRVVRPRGDVRGLPVDVVARTTLGKRASVAVLRVGDRGLVVGVTDHAVSLIAEVAIPESPAAAPERRTTLDLSDVGLLVAEPAVAEAAARGALTGSVLSPSTWRAAAAVLRDRTVRP